MEWRILSEPELYEMYLPQLGRDFGPEELRPREAAMALLRGGCYRPWGVWDDDGQLAAYLFLAECDGIGPVLLDYFGVLPQYRSRGLGEQLLKTLYQKLQRPILIETEWPERAPDPAMARRRLGFYRRCGAVPTPYYDRAFQGWFYVYLLAGDGCTPAMAEAAGPQLDAIYHVLMPEAMRKENFEIGRIFHKSHTQI